VTAATPTRHTRRGAVTRPGEPRPGDVLLVTRDASVQFLEPILFRVIAVSARSAYDGWLWLSGYQLRPDGTATERRDIFVQADGLRPGRLNEPAQQR